MPAQMGGVHAPERKPDGFAIYYLVKSFTLVVEASVFRMGKQLSKRLVVYMKLKRVDSN